MNEYLKDVDGRLFYIQLVDPFITFNKVEITLSHLFRKKSKIIQNRNYADCLYQFLNRKNIIREDIVEIGCGLGDLASSFLSRGRNKIKKYSLYDLSEKLIAVQKLKLKHKRNVRSFIHDDCLNLSKHFDNFSGLILSNGMIADLRSVCLNKKDKLKDYGIDDEELIDFADKFERDNNTKEWYFHVGALLFIREISKTISQNGTAVITEYGATSLNQPSFFVNHFECGIDFEQIEAYARRLGFDTEVVEMDDIMSLSQNEKFLSVDVFTSQDKLAKRMPIAIKLWTGKNQLPVLAYTKESLSEMLSSKHMGFSKTEALKMVKGLDSCFHSLHHPEFDHLNPTTWGYKCLLMKKKQPDWAEVVSKSMVKLLKELDGVEEKVAVKRWNDTVYKFENREMGELENLFIEAFLAPGLYDLVKKFGPVAWVFFCDSLLPKIKSHFPNNPEYIEKFKKIFKPNKSKSHERKRSKGN